MRTKYLLLSLLLLSVDTYAQEVNYYFEQYTNSYENLDDPINLTGGMIWDEPEFTIPVDIGFNFFNKQLETINHTSLGADLYHMCHHNVGEMPDMEEYVNLGIMPMTADIADRAYWEDNEFEPGSLSPISYKVLGFG